MSKCIRRQTNLEQPDKPALAAPKYERFSCDVCGWGTDTRPPDGRCGNPACRAPVKNLGAAPERKPPLHRRPCTKEPPSEALVRMLRAAGCEIEDQPPEGVSR